MLRVHVVAIGIVLLLAASCTRERTTLLEPRSSLAGADAAGAVERPFHGWFEGQLRFVPPFEPGSLAHCNAQFSGDPAHPGPSVSAFDEATGVFSFLGRIRLESTFCFDPDSPSSAGTGILTGMNGERVFIGFENSAGAPGDDGRIPVHGTQWITGGTGRFGDATGHQDCQLVVDGASLRVGGQCAGTIHFSPSR